MTASTQTHTMIEIDDLEFHYGSEFSLRVPSLRIERGERVAIVGPSGSGKTTLLSLVAGVTVPHAGRVRTLGVEVSGLGDTARREFRAARVGLVFQEFELLEYLSVLDNVLLPCRISSALRLDAAARARAAELAGRVGLADKLGRPATRLSHGERQRVAVCRALLTEPELLLADEPTGNLDPSNRERVLDILFDYTRDKRATLVTVTHDHGMLDRFDRTVDAGSLGVVSAGAAT